MEKKSFPIEFNNEIDEIQKSENEYYTLAVDRINELTEGHDDILGAMVNFKQPAKGHQTPYVFEVTIVLYMGSNQIVATEKGENFQSTLDGALDAVERQVHEHRNQLLEER